MKLKSFLIPALVVILFIVAVIYFVSTREMKSPVIEQLPSINEPGTATAPVSEPTITNEEHRVLVSTDKTRYVLGEKVSVTIKNNTDKTVWLAAPCGPPLSLLKANLTDKKNAFDWEIHRAYPNIIDCTSPMPLKIESKREINYMLDLESVYASVYTYEHFSIKPARYKFEIQYTGVDAKFWPLTEFVYLKSFSNEFFLVAK